MGFKNLMFSQMQWMLFVTSLNMTAFFFSDNFMLFPDGVLKNGTYTSKWYKIQPIREWLSIFWSVSSWVCHVLDIQPMFCRPGIWEWHSGNSKLPFWYMFVLVYLIYRKNIKSNFYSISYGFYKSL